MQFDALPLPVTIGIFIGAALVIGVAGSRLARLADQLGERTGLGEAIAGALFLGASTSLPGIITSVTAAWDGYAELSVSNAVGGIAAQTVFLSVADVAYRRSNLEHAAYAGDLYLWSAPGQAGAHQTALEAGANPEDRRGCALA